MIPTSFAYQRANSVDEALELLSAASGDTKLIAGGHSLLPLMKLRLARPDHLVDIARIPELTGCRVEGGALVIGAATRYRDLIGDPLVQEHVPALAEAARVVADPQVRNRGTIGGSLAHADPAADLPAVLMAAGAELDVAKRGQRRTVPMDQWYVAPLMAALDADELVTAIRIPTNLPARQVYLKFPHPASGYALTGVAVMIDFSQDGVITSVRIGVTGGGAIPFRARQAEDQLRGQRLTEAVVAAAQTHGADDGDYADDAFYSAAYRRNLVQVMIGRAVMRAAE
jgi:carbon-monoxide dehydrogenase medium subunit